jgi:rod shape determining protein RodA
MKWAEGIDKLGLDYTSCFVFSLLQISIVWMLYWGKKQLIFFGISCVCWYYYIFTRNKFFENMSAIIYVGGVLLLIGLFLSEKKF